MVLQALIMFSINFFMFKIQNFKECYYYILIAGHAALMETKQTNLMQLHKLQKQFLIFKQQIQTRMTRVQKYI